MTLDELRTRLQAAAGGAFTVAQSDLAFPAAAALFRDWFPDGNLTLQNAEGHSTALTAAGTLTVAGAGGGGPLPALVSFTANESDITGMQVEVTLDIWAVTTTALTVDVRCLNGLGIVTVVRLMLAAQGGAAEALAGLAIDVPLAGQTVTLTGWDPGPFPSEIPASRNWVLDAELSLALNDLGELSALATGLDPTDFKLPPDVPVLDSLQLCELRMVIDTDAGNLVLFYADVKVLDDWVLIPQVCELSDGHVGVTIVSPASGAFFGARLWATVTIAGVAVVASLTLPDLVFGAYLAGPINVGALFDQYFPAAQIALDLQYAKLSVDISSQTWELRFGIDAGPGVGWTLGGVVLESVEVAIGAVGTADPSGSVTAALALDGTRVLLSGSYDTESGWRLTGRTDSGTTIDGGAALASLATRFSVALPPTLSELELTSIALEVSSRGPTFDFTLAGDFPLAGVSADFAVAVGLSWANAQFDGRFTAQLTLPLATRSMQFGGELTVAAQTTFELDWHDSAPVPLDQVAAALGLDLSALPAGLLPAVSEIALGYDSTNSTAVMTMVTADIASVWGMTIPTGATERTFATAIHVKAGFRLSDVPLVGADVPASDDVGIDAIDLLLASGPLTPTDTTRMNGRIPSSVPPAARFPGAGIPDATVDVAIAYVLAGQPQPPLMMAVATPPGVTAGTSPIPPGPPTKWLTVGRSFGPVELIRVGASYVDGMVWLLVDGAVHVGGLTLGVQRLGAGFALHETAPYLPAIKLAGIGVGYDEPPLEITGALLCLTPTPTPTPPATFEAAGLLSAATASFSLTAFGAFAARPDGPALFAFAAAGGHFGGPPPFFVTGLAGGFGYHSAVRVPAQQEVAQFPLVTALADPAAFARQDPVAVLTSLMGGTDPWVSFAPGSLWLAAGLKFTSFELVTTTAVLIGELGDGLTLALIGESTATLPPDAAAGDPTYAKVTLELEAVYRSQEGTFLATALVASGSYVIDPACALTGGFAFALWFDPSPHAGDFVVTLGGYHPAFTPASWYPQEPRLGFSWSVTDDLTISGQAYMALTPSAVMVGGELDVDYHAGDLHAWLRAWVNAIVWFQPFAFSVDVGISVGASYTLSVLGVSKTFSAELGADLSVWGPPTAGRVTVHWWVISFTVHFGEGDAPNPQPLTWSEFIGLLPKPADAVRISGLTAVTQPRSGPWLASAYGFQFSTSSAVPATHLATQDGTTYEYTGTPLAIRPMQVALTGTHTVRISQSGTDAPLSGWTFEPLLQNAPKALWGQGDGSRLEAGDEQLVPQVPVGYTVTVPPPVEGGTPGPVADPSDLLADPLPPAPLTITPQDAPTGPVPIVDGDSIATIQSGLVTAANARATLRDALQALGTTVPDDDLTAFAAQSGHAFANPPMLVTS